MPHVLFTHRTNEVNISDDRVEAEHQGAGQQQEVVPHHTRVERFVCQREKSRAKSSYRGVAEPIRCLFLLISCR